MSPNQEYLELNYVAQTATGLGNNNKIIMENLGNGDFRVIDGQVGVKIGRHKPKTYTMPMVEWEDFYTGKITRGYLVTKTCKTEKKIVKKGGQFKKLADEFVQAIIDRLLDFASQVVEEGFTVKVDDISDEMIAYGKEVLDDLSVNYKTMSVAIFNSKLMSLYKAIPRRIARLSSLLATRESEFPEIINREQELYDTMVSQVRLSSIQSEEHTVLDAYGLDWRKATDEEFEVIKKKMGNEGVNLVNAWRIVNKATEKRFNEFCEKENLTEENGGVNHCFHGSRSENFWSIITNGLTINPVGVVITGKAFGNGTYFAIDACKSMGYTNRSGSTWAHGTSATGFMGIYKVATGKEYVPQNCDTSLNWKKLQQISPGAHCTWYHTGGSIGFRMDEIIVYQDQQDTIEYLLEVKR